MYGNISDRKHNEILYYLLTEINALYHADDPAEYN